MILLLNYDLSRMKQRVTFGTVKTIPDDTLEGSHTEFVPITTVYCGEYTNTMNQTFTNLGTKTDVDLVLVIRHNPLVKQGIRAKYQDTEYRVAAVNSDDRLNAFDEVTLRLTNKVGTDSDE